MFKFKFNSEKHNNRGSNSSKKSSSMGSVYKDYDNPDDQWQKSSGGTLNSRESFRAQEEAKEQMLLLEQENNLLKLKVEVLLDMLAQKTAEAELQEADILKMKNVLANS